MLKLYPVRSFEAEAEKEDGAKVYVNIGVPSDGKLLDGLYEDNWWAYTKPLDEVNFEDVEADYDYSDGTEYVAMVLTNMWNACPKFVESDWIERS